MKYRDLYINYTDMPDIVRQDSEDNDVHCRGICFQIYADHDYAVEIYSFIGAYGYEIEDSEESIEEFVKSNVDDNYAEIKSKQFYALIEKDYKEFEYDVRQFDEDYDIIDNAEQISNIQRAKEYLLKYKPVKLEDMEYIVTLRRPLETITDYFSQDEAQFTKEFCECISMVVQEKKNNYGLIEEFDSNDERILDAQEPENEQGMSLQ